MTITKIIKLILPQNGGPQRWRRARMEIGVLWAKGRDRLLPRPRFGMNWGFRSGRRLLLRLNLGHIFGFCFTGVFRFFFWSSRGERRLALLRNDGALELGRRRCHLLGREIRAGDFRRTLRGFLRLRGSHRWTRTWRWRWKLNRGRS